MTDHQHTWHNTGKEGVHVEFPTLTRGRRQLYAVYIRCDCGQIGFRRPGSKAVYTWTREDT